MKYKLSVINLFFLMMILNSCQNRPLHTLNSVRVLLEFSDEMKKTQNMKVCKVGSQVSDEIGFTTLCYTTVKKLDLCESREFLVQNILNFLEKMNKDTEMFLYLHDYPFTIQNLKFEIIFQNDELIDVDTRNTNYVGSPYIAKVGCDNGRVNYYVYDLIERELYTLYEESFEEALEIVDKKNVYSEKSLVKFFLF